MYYHCVFISKFCLQLWFFSVLHIRLSCANKNFLLTYLLTYLHCRLRRVLGFRLNMLSDASSYCHAEQMADCSILLDNWTRNFSVRLTYAVLTTGSWMQTVQYSTDRTVQTVSYRSLQLGRRVTTFRLRAIIYSWVMTRGVILKKTIEGTPKRSGRTPGTKTEPKYQKH